MVQNLALAFPDAIFYKPTDIRTIALTIDDVPTPGVLGPCPTRWILDAIADHNQSVSNPDQVARATFFIIGNHLNRDNTLLYDLVVQGHEIANHGMFDTWAALQSPKQFRQQFQTTHERLIEQVPDLVIGWYRPGRALYSPVMLQVLKETAYNPYFALASMLPLDTLAATAEPAFTAQYTLQHVFPGAILLLHGGSVERSKNTAQALKLLLPQLTAAGYQVRTLSELWALQEAQQR